MKCPYCKRNVKEGRSVCPRCGSRLSQENLPQGILDGDFVYLENDSKNKRVHIIRNIIIIVLLALILGGGAFFGYRFLKSQSGKTEKPKETTGVTLPTVELTSAPAAALPETTGETVPQTTEEEDNAEEKTDEEMLDEYAQNSGLKKTLTDAVENDIRVSVTTAENAVIARYQSSEYFSDDSQSEYFSDLIKELNTLCARLDREVFDMKNNSGVPGAVLEIFGVDCNGVEFYSGLVD